MVRQRENLLVLLENEQMYRKAIADQGEAEGLAQDRYAIYLESIEAAQNKLSASWENMWQKLIPPEVLIDSLNLVSKALDAIADSTEGFGKEKFIGNWVDETEKDVDTMLSTFEKGLGIFKKSQKEAGWFADMLIRDKTVIFEGLQELANGVAKNAETYEEYQSAITKAAEIVGLSNTEVRHNIDVLSRQEFEQIKVANAIDTTNDALREQIELTKQVNANEPAQREVTPQFTDYIYTALQAFGEGDEVFNEIGVNLASLNREFEAGILSYSEYFEQLQLQLENIDVAEMLKEDTGAAEVFFTGVVTEGIQRMGELSAQFDEGNITITKYAESLAELSDVFSIVGDMSYDFIENMGLTEEQASAITEVVGGALGEIGTATEELRAMQELNIMVQDAYVQSVQQSLQFGTEAYNDYMMQISQAAAISGQSFVDLQGNALTSADSIYGFLTANTGNFKVFADQTANKTGQVIQRIVNNVGRLITELGNAISSFKGEINFSVVPQGVMNFDGMFMGEVLNMLQIPQFGIQVGTQGFNMSSIGGIISGIGEDLSSLDFDFDANIYTNPAALETAANEASNLADTLGSVSNAFKNLGEGSDSATDEIKEDLKDMGDLLDIVVDKIKQEQKALRDALKEQLKSYKSIIKERKNLLRSMEKEKEYQDALEDKQRSLSVIQSEMIELRLDDSEEAQARLLALQEEEAEILRDIEDDQYAHSIDLQEAALDAEASNFEDFITGQINAIDEYLSQPGQIVNDAMAIIEARGESLYGELINWNRIYGSGIDADVVQAWEDAYDVLERYRDGLNQLNYQHAAGELAGVEIPDIRNPAHSLPLRDYPSILPGAPIPKPIDAGNYENVGLAGISIDSLINVQGNMDSSILPDIRNIAEKVVKELNSEMLQRGITRSATSFSI